MPEQRGDQQLAKDLQEHKVAEGRSANAIASSIKAEIGAQMEPRFFQLQKDLDIKIESRITKAENTLTLRLGALLIAALVVMGLMLDYFLS